MQTSKEAELNMLNSTPGSSLYYYQKDLEKVTDGLERFGLSKNQARVFVYLGKYGSKTSREVCKALNLPRTETYTILKSLLNKGIITSEFEHPTKFTPLSLSRAMSVLVQASKEKLDSLTKKEIELTKLWSKIPSSFDNTIDAIDEKFQMLKGFNRINTKIKEILKTTENECNILCTERDLTRFYYSDLIEQLGSMPIDVKLIVSPSQKLPQYVRMLDLTKVRILPNIDVNNQCFIIKDFNEVLIFIRNNDWPARNLLAFWTDSSSMVKSMKLLFQYSWKNALSIDYEKYLRAKYP